MSRHPGLNWVVAWIAVVGGWSVFYSACSPTKVGDDEGANGGGKGGGAASNGGGKGGSSGNSGSTDGGMGKSDAGFIIEFPDALEENDGPALPNGTENPLDTLEACGAYTFKVERTPPELMIVFDRSGSMMRMADGNTGPLANSRWTYTRGALNEVLMATEDDISWGIKMYPACKAKDIANQALGCEYPAGSGIHNDCAVDGLVMEPDLSQYDELATFTQQNSPTIDRGNTPTAAAVDAALAVMQARTTPNPKFMLLATDGEPRCSANPVADSVAAIARVAAAGIPVFVTGVAISDNPMLAATHDALNQMADAGGRARTGTTRYHSALDRIQLVAALNEIAAATISCTFPLKEVPRDDAQAAVDVDGKRLPEDATNGWSFAPSKKAIIFNGLACEKLKRGEFKETAVTFGCPGKPLPEPPPPAL